MAPETPKGVSSRLLTMKFMQRAAATEPSNASPDSATSSSSKKRKLDHSPAQGRLSVNFDQASVQAALAEQEAQRQSALNRHTSGDTHWVLNTSLPKSKTAKSAVSKPKIVYVGYGDVDLGNESSDHEDVPQKGRTSTSNYKQPKKKIAKTEADDDGEDSRDSDSSDDDDDDDRDRRSAKHTQAADSVARNSSRNASRSRSQSRQSSESTKAKEFRDKRRKKEVRLSKPTSISSGGQKGNGASAGMTCYNCQGSGHKSADCPKKASRSSKSK